MSANDFSNVLAQQPPPQHRTHASTDVLPGAKGGAAAPDYSAEVTNDPEAWKSNNERRFGAGTDTGAVIAGGQHRGDTSETERDRQHDAMHEERPMNVQPTGAGTRSRSPRVILSRLHVLQVVSPSMDVTTSPKDTQN